MAEFLAENRELFAAIVGGVIAILGTVAALITSHYLRQAGKVSVILSSSEFMLLKRDSYGGEGKTESISEAESLRITLGLDIYNSADAPKSLREIVIDIKPKTKKGSHSYPFYIFDKSSQSALMPYKKLEIINLQPKELKHLDFSSWAKKEELGDLRGEVVVYFRALYPNGRKLKIHILTTEIKEFA